MLTVYLDESGNGKQERAFLLAGYGAHDEDWARLSPQLDRRIKAEGLPEFHASDCEQGRNYFKGMSGLRRTALQFKLIRLLADPAHGLTGYLSTIQMEPYRRLWPRFNSEQEFAGEVGNRRWQFLELANGVDWPSVGYFNEAGLLKVLEILERDRAKAPK
jgi:hypothetical protein